MFLHKKYIISVTKALLLREHALSLLQSFEPNGTYLSTSFPPLLYKASFGLSSGGCRSLRGSPLWRRTAGMYGYLAAGGQQGEGGTAVAMDEQLFIQHFKPSGEAVSTVSNYAAIWWTLIFPQWSGSLLSGSPVNKLSYTSCAGVQLVDWCFQLRLSNPQSSVTWIHRRPWVT